MNIILKVNNMHLGTNRKMEMNARAGHDHTPVPINMTLYFSPSKACTCFTIICVNAAPLCVSNGLPPIGSIAWSMSGFSRMNWRVLSGRSRVVFISELVASLFMHWWRRKARRERKGAQHNQGFRRNWFPAELTHKKEQSDPLRFCFAPNTSTTHVLN